MTDTAVEWWEATDEAVTPFDEADDNPYQVQDFEDANDLETQADRAFKAGSAADDQGDKFELATVLLALTLFFAGIATLFRQRSVNLGLLAVSAVVLVAGSVQLMGAF